MSTKWCHKDYLLFQHIKEYNYFCSGKKENWEGGEFTSKYEEEKNVPEISKCELKKGQKEQ